MTRTVPGCTRLRCRGEARDGWDFPGFLATIITLSLLAYPLPAAIAQQVSGVPAPGGGYVGTSACSTDCHEDLAESYAKTAHGWALSKLSLPPAERGCEACHGPAEVHVEEEGGKGSGNLETFSASRSAVQRSAVCLRCHAGTVKTQAYRNSTHALSGVACTDCHAGHKVRADPMLRRASPELCYSCHPEQRAQFALPEHHKVNEGVIDCIDCHNPHGSRDRFALLGTNNRECFRCHGELEGPFVFEHGSVLIEGCTRCHTPHGGIDRHLLKYQQVAQVCYECHVVTPGDHLQPSFRDCTRCHVSIHGSNTDPHFLQQ